MAQAFVAAGEVASVLRQGLSAYGVQGLSDERTGVSEGEKHGASD